MANAKQHNATIVKTSSYSYQKQKHLKALLSINKETLGDSAGDSLRARNIDPKESKDKAMQP